jgi:hypothetical protein
MRTLFSGSALLLALVLGNPPALAQSAEEEAAEAEARKAIELAIETAHQEQNAALAAVEQARVELERAADERERAENSEERARLHEMDQAERERMRGELSRVHEDLRRASQEVARLHREINRPPRPAAAPDAPGGSDRAVIGVVLGDSTRSGVPVLGVSPDGPAERAGIQQGDLIVAMMGAELIGEGKAKPRDLLSEVMDGVKVGDELVITVLRDGQRIDHTVTADRREPFAWQSILRLPSAPPAPGAAPMPGVPAAPLVQHIEIPEIDREVLREQAERVRQGVERARIVIENRFDGEDWSYEFETLSELGDDALREASIWFGLPVTRGLKLAEMDADLAGYFKADGGVLVLKAPEGNDLQLRSGDVIQRIGEQQVSTPSDVMRALREWEPGASIEIQIKRERRDRTLDVVLPERRVGFDFLPFSEHPHILKSKSSD